MDTILSENELTETLNSLRDTLLHYDFSEVDNIIFYDIESFTNYIETHRRNPFEMQYRDIEHALTKLGPYLPTHLSPNAIDILSQTLSEEFGNKSLVDETILLNIKLDFIDDIKKIQSEDEWEALIDKCNTIRKNLSTKKEAITPIYI